MKRNLNINQVVNLLTLVSMFNKGGCSLQSSLWKNISIIVRCMALHFLLTLHLFYRHFSPKNHKVGENGIWMRSGYVHLLHEFLEKKRMHHHALITSKLEAITFFFFFQRKGDHLQYFKIRQFFQWPREK